MPLKIELKAGERIILGGCIVTNGGPRTQLLIEGELPILREKEIMTPARADSPAKRIYLAIQLMYTSSDSRLHHDLYFRLVNDIVRAAPSTWTLIEAINNQILTGETYKALKTAKKLIAYEEELLTNARRRPGLHHNRQANRQSA